MEKVFKIHKIGIDVSEGPDGKLVMGNFFKIGMLHVTENGKDVLPPQEQTIQAPGTDPDIQAIIGESASIHAQLDLANQAHATMQTEVDNTKADCESRLKDMQEIVDKAVLAQQNAEKAQKEAEDKVAKLKEVLG